jgi:Transposase domain (DUF772)
VPNDHLVRAIACVLDLSWVHSELASYYPQIGRPSIDPELMIRMLIIGYVFAIRSERALCCRVGGMMSEGAAGERDTANGPPARKRPHLCYNPALPKVSHLEI